MMQLADRKISTRLSIRKLSIYLGEKSQQFSPLIILLHLDSSFKLVLFGALNEYFSKKSVKTAV